MSTDTYRAAVVPHFGPPEVIAIEDILAPVVPANAVLIATRAAGVNPVDARIRNGTFGGSVPYVPGRELAGTVVAVGAGVQGVGVGDDVVGFGTASSHAELVIAAPENLSVKPASVPWDIAGGISGVGQTAVMAVETLMPVEGEVAVIHGAAGGVGSILVQLLVQRGVAVIGTAGPANQAYLEDLGATAVTYGPGVADRIRAAAPRPVTISVDLAGSAEAGAIGVEVQIAGGRAVTLVPETAQSHGIRLLRSQPNRRWLDELLADVAAGDLTVTVDVLPFDRIVAAHERLDAKHARGKLVLDFAANPHLPR